jgi:hypothetical protein
MARQTNNDGGEALSNGRGCCRISTNHESVSTGFQRPTGAIGVVWRAFDELADGLIESVRQRGVDNLAEGEMVLGLE